MKKSIACLILFIFIALIFSYFYPSRFTLFPVYADEIEDLQKQIDELSKAREQSIAATKPLEGQLNSLRVQLSQIQAKLKTLANSITQKETELKVREDKLVYQQALLSSRVRSYYIRSFSTSPLVMLLSSSDSSDLLRELTYRQMATLEDQRVITTVTTEMIGLIEQKEKLEHDKIKMASLQAQVDKNADFLDSEITEAKTYQADLSKKIADLSAKQQAILAAKSGSFTTAVGDVPLADDPKASPNYNPGFSPAFAAFSFGGYTHRKGMSQYGAKGRAEAGQGANQILKAYYGKDPASKDTSGSISVQGVGTIDFEGNYLLGIAEMPSAFPKEALKAQAIAARTYAYRYKIEGKSICTTEACQVYSKSKASSSPSEWRQAVEETKGQIIEDVVTYYSSTTGGYLTTSGWDTTDGQGGPGFASRAWESKAKSPWFYKGWYTEGYSISSATCGRSHPWLSAEEFADILNAWVVLMKHSQSDDKITPWGSCWGSNPYSIEELRNKASGLGIGYRSVLSVSVTYNNSGETASVSLGTDQGSVTINGADFKKAFNLRAPGYISIKSPLFNIERK